MTRDLRPGGDSFYGWKLVGALCVILFFTAGGGLYVFPVFIGSFQEEFGWSMTEISGGAALFAIVMGFSTPAVGLLFARFGARRTMLAAGAVMVLALLGYAALTSLWMLYAILVVSGFGVAGTTILPAQTLVTNWFQRYRGRAMGLTLLGIGFGGFLLPPLNELLIRLWGWRFTWVFSSLTFLLIVLPLIVFFVRTRPADLGLLPDGANPGEEEAEDEGAAVSGLPVRRAVATPTFWMVVAIFLLQLIALSALTFHFVPFATQEGEFSSQQAAFYYGLAVGFSIAGRLLFGWLADRWKVALLMAATGVSMAIGVAALELLIVRLGLRDARLLWLYSVPFGTGIGGQAVIMPVLVGRCFGELHFSKIMGLVMSGFALGVIVGIPLSGWIFDRTGSYEWAFVVCALGLLASAMIAAQIRPERYRAEFSADT